GGGRAAGGDRGWPAADAYGVNYHRASVVDDQGMQRIVLELVAPVKERQLDHECDADDAAAELLDEAEGRGHRASRCQQVVDGEHPLTRHDRVRVDGERVPAVLELVLHLDRLP